MNEAGNRTPPPPPAQRRTVLYHGAKFDFVEVEYPGADGSPLKRQIIRHPGAVVILPILVSANLPGPHIVLIRNQRIPAGTHLWELPAGTREPGEAPELTAGRELIEETGYRAANLTPMGVFYTSPGLSDEQMWAYAATDLTPVPQALEDDERITVHPVPVQEVLSMIDRGALADAKSMLTVLLALRRGLLPGIKPAP